MWHSPEQDRFRANHTGKPGVAAKEKHTLHPLENYANIASSLKADGTTLIDLDVDSWVPPPIIIR